MKMGQTQEEITKKVCVRSSAGADRVLPKFLSHEIRHRNTFLRIHPWLETGTAESEMSFQGTRRNDSGEGLDFSIQCTASSRVLL